MDYEFAVSSCLGGGGGGGGMMLIFLGAMWYTIWGLGFRKLSRVIVL